MAAGSDYLGVPGITLPGAILVVGPAEVGPAEDDGVACVFVDGVAGWAVGLAGSCASRVVPQKNAATIKVRIRFMEVSCEGAQDFVPGARPGTLLCTMQHGAYG